MVQINFAQKQVNAKIVYYGPGMSGKTTNLEVIHQRAPEGNRGDLTSISTEGDRTLFFDFMPLDLGTVAGMRTCFQIYTVPGQVYYNSTRKLVLQGVDGVIFVADSSPNMMEENLESLRNLAENLQEYGRSIEEMPIVIQYNKRDIPGALSIEELEEKLNHRGAPAFEAIANTGQGVFPTLKAMAASVLDSLHRAQTDASGMAAVPAEVPGAQPAVAPLGESAAGATESLPSAPEPARPTGSMSQTGFHKAPSLPLQGAAPVASAAPQTPQVAQAAPAVAPGLRMAAPPKPGGVNPGGGLQMQQPAAPTPAPAVQQAPVAVQPQAQPVQQAPPAPAGATAVMGVEEGTRAPARRVPASQSFPTTPAPRATPTGQNKQSAVVTGAIIVASIGLGALLGSYVLSIL